MRRWLGPGSGDDGEAGAISVMAVGLLVAMILATSLAVDVGRITWASRDQQGVADRMALDAALELDRSDLETAGDLLAAVRQTVSQSFQRNAAGLLADSAPDEFVTLIELGNLDPDSGIFYRVCGTDTGCGMEPASGISAIRVWTSTDVPLLFALGGDDERTIVRDAVAEKVALASITTGSEVAGIEGGLLEQVLDGLLCSLISSDCSLDIGAAGYQGLATTDIHLGELVQALETEVGSTDQVLNADVTALQLVTALINVLDAQGHPDEVAALRILRARLPTDQLVIPLADLIRVSTADADVAADATLDVLGLVTGGLQVANRDHLVSVPGLGVGVPGIADIDTQLTVIEAPVTAIGRAHFDTAAGQWSTRAESAQVRLGLDTSVLPSALGLNLGVASLDVDPLRLPIGVETGRSVASLTGIDCLATPEPNTTTRTSTDVARLFVGERVEGSDEVQPADITSVELVINALGIAKITVTVDVDLLVDLPLGGGTKDHTFVADDHVTTEVPDEPQPTYPRGPDAVRGSLLEAGDLEASDLEISLRDTRIDVDLLFGLIPLPVPVGEIVNPILSLLVSGLVEGLLPVLTTVVSTVVDPLLSVLGAGLGNADTWANWATCGTRRLGPLQDVAAGS